MNKRNFASTTFLIALLTVVLFVGIWQIKPAQATTDIVLPYTISSSGTYSITGVGSFSGTGLTINADNIYVDGQNFLQTQNDGSITVYVSNGHSNITIVNFNQNRTTVGTSGQYGFYLVGLSDSLISNCTFRRNYDNYIYDDSHNYTIENCVFDHNVVHNVKSYGVGFDHHNFTIKDCRSYSPTYWGFTAQNCYDFVWENCTSYDSPSTAGSYGFITDGTNHDYIVRDCNSVDDYTGFSFLGARNATLLRYVATGIGERIINLENSSNILISSCNLTGSGSSNGISLSASSTACDNVTIQQSILANNAYGVYTPAGNNINYTLNYFQTSTKPILETAGVNHTVLHNAYINNASASTIMATGKVLNDTALGLTVTKTGSGTITPVNGLHAVNGGNWSIYFSAAPDAGWSLTSFILNGVDLGATSPCICEINIDSEMVATFLTEPPEDDYNHMSGSDLVAHLLPSQKYYTVQPNGTYYSIKGSDNSTLISGTDGEYVLRQTLGNMTSQASWQINASITVSATLSISPSNLCFNLQNATLTLSANTVFISITSGGNFTFNGGYFVGPQTVSANNRVLYATNVATLTFNGTDISGFPGNDAGLIIVGYGTTNATFQRCNIHDNLVGNAGSEYFNLLNSGYNNITNCTLAYGGTEIFIENGCGHNSITYCDFYGWHAAGTYGHGIYLDGGSSPNTGFNDISHNKFHDPVAMAALQIKCNNNTIHDNEFYNFSSQGVGFSIYSQYSPSYANDNDIYNNNFTNMYYMFWIGHRGDLYSLYPTDGNKIHDNNFTDIYKAFQLNAGYADEYYPIIANVSNTQIYNNIFSNVTEIFAYPHYNFVLMNDLIWNTTIRDNDFGGATIDSSIQTCHNTLVYNNTDLTSWYKLDLSVVGNGYTVPDGLGWQYYTGTSASVAWTPTGGNNRQDFSIDGANQTTTTSPISITMSADHVGIAYFSGTPPPVIITITLPANTTYGASVSVQISASGGTIDRIWWNCTYSDGTPAYANTTYTVPTTMTLGVGNYVFYAMANNTDGEWAVKTVAFTVEIGFGTVTVTWGGYWGRWWGYP